MPVSRQSKYNHQCMARLTKYLRMTVYSYLDIEETALKVTLLSKQERAEIYQSIIAREGKSLMIKIVIGDHHFVKGSFHTASQLKLRYARALMLADRIEIGIRYNFKVR